MTFMLCRAGPRRTVGAEGTDWRGALTIGRSGCGTSIRRTLVRQTASADTHRSRPTGLARRNPERLSGTALTERRNSPLLIAVLVFREFGRAGRQRAGSATAITSSAAAWSNRPASRAGRRHHDAGAFDQSDDGPLTGFTPVSANCSTASPPRPGDFASHVPPRARQSGTPDRAISGTSSTAAHGISARVLILTARPRKWSGKRLAVIHRRGGRRCRILASAVEALAEGGYANASLRPDRQARRDLQRRHLLPFRRQDDLAAGRHPALRLRVPNTPETVRSRRQSGLSNKLRAYIESNLVHRRQPHADLSSPR